jgi:hypothetical protein
MILSITTQWMTVIFLLLYFAVSTSGKIINKDYCDPVLFKEACIDKTLRIDFNRISKQADVHKHLSLRIYAHSKETSLINTMIIFHTDTNSYHNAFMIGSSQMTKYNKITRESRLSYNDEITIITKSVKFTTPFTVINTYDRQRIYDPDHNNYLKDAYRSYLTTTTSNAQENDDDMLSLYHQQRYLQSVLTRTHSEINMPTTWEPFVLYDALLSLDRYSSIWDQYNVLSIERTQLSLRYNEQGQLSDELEDFNEIIRIQCKDPSSEEVAQRKIHPKSCIIHNIFQLIEATTTTKKIMEENNNTTTKGVIVNGKFYANYKVVIDLTLRTNSIPIDLYLEWKKDKNVGITIALSSVQNGDNNVSSLEAATTSSTSFVLNSNFDYHLNDNDVILVGVDLLYHFQKIEYSVDANQIHLWVQSNFYNSNKHDSIQIITAFLILFVLLPCLFCWVMDINYISFYQLLHYDALSVIKLKGKIYFSYIQVQYEIIVILVTILLWILGGVFILDNQHDHLPSIFQFNHSSHRQVYGLFLFLSIFHVILLTVVIAFTGKVNRKLIEYYKQRYNRYFGNSTYSHIPMTIGPVKSSSHPTKSVSIMKTRLKQSKRFAANVENTITPFWDDIADVVKDDDEEEDATNKKRERRNKKMKKKSTDDEEQNGKDEHVEDRENRRRREQEEMNRQERMFAEKYHMKVVESPFPLVLVRNLAFVVLIFSCFFCIFLFDNNNVYRVYLVVMACILTFFMSYYIFMLFIYLTTSASRTKQNAPISFYILILIIEILLFIGFLIWSIISIHLDYFLRINSVYSEVIIYRYVISVTSKLVLFGLFTIYIRELLGYLKDRYFIT